MLIMSGTVLFPPPPPNAKIIRVVKGRERGHPSTHPHTHRPTDRQIRSTRDELASSSFGEGRDPIKHSFIVMSDPWIHAPTV